MSEIVTVANEAAFNERALQGDACIVFFDASWCGACRGVETLLRETLAESPSLRVVRVDVDTLPALPRRYGVAGLPTLVLFVRGQPASIKVGEVDRENLDAWLEMA